MGSESAERGGGQPSRRHVGVGAQLDDVAVRVGDVDARRHAPGAVARRRPVHDVEPARGGDVLDAGRVHDEADVVDVAAEPAPRRSGR